MRNRTLHWRLIGIAIVGWFCLCGLPLGIAQENAKDAVAAQAAEPQAAQVRETLLLHFSGDGDAEQAATGLQLLLSSRLQGNQDLSLVNRLLVLDAASKGRVLKGRSRLFRKDIPYLCLKTESRRAVIGWVELDLDEIIVTLRVFDGVSAENLASVELRENYAHLSKLVQRMAESLEQLLGRKVRLPAAPPKTESIDLEGLKRLGQGWLALEKKDRNPGLSTMLGARDEGLEIGSVVASWINEKTAPLLGKKLTKWTKANQALLADLSEQPKQALELYESIKPIGKRGWEMGIRHARLLLREKKWPQFKAWLKKLGKIQPNDAELALLNGYRLMNEGNKAQALKSWEAALSGGIENLEALQALAQNAAAENNKSEAIELYTKAAQLLSRRHRNDSANEMLLSALEQGGPETLMNKLSLLSLTPTQKERLQRYTAARHTSKTQADVFLEARQARLAGKVAEAEELLYNAAGIDAKSFEPNLAAGNFFSNEKLDIDKSIRFYGAAVKASDNDPRALLGLALSYQRADFCNKAQESFEKLLKIIPENRRIQLLHTEMLRNCGQAEKAEQRVQQIVQQDADYAPALIKLVSYYDITRDAQKRNAALNELKSLDAREYLLLTKEPKVVKTEAKKEKKPRKKRTPVKVQFPITKNLMKAVPTGLERVALVSKDRLEMGFLDRVFNWLFSLWRMNPKPIGKDLAALISNEAKLVQDSEIADMIRIYPGMRPFRPDSFDKVTAKFDLNAVVLYDLVQRKQDGMDVDLYCFVRGGSEVLYTSGRVSFNSERLQKRNAGIVIPPLLMVVLIAGLIFWRRMGGFGRVRVEIKYDQKFEEGYFLVRLSKRNTSQPFPVEKLKGIEFDSNRSETELKIRSVFKSRSPLVTVTSLNEANLYRVPPGKYFVFVTGIMFDLKTRQPIGTYEVTRETEVEKDRTSEVRVNMEITEAYVEVRVTQEVMVTKTVTETEDGESKEVEQQVLQHQEIGGATVEVNNDAALTKVTIEGEPVTYYFGLGTYQIKASYNDLAAVHNLKIEDTTPKLIELKLVAKSKATLAASPLSLDMDMDMGAPMADVNAELSMEDLLSNSDSSTPTASSFDKRPGSKTEPPQPIELSDDILTGPIPTITHGAPPINPGAGDASRGPVDLEDVFETSRESELEKLFEATSELTPEAAREQYLKHAREMQQARRFDEAAELFMRAGMYDQAAEMCQRSGNQRLTYKVYGYNYLNSGSFREAVEMFKYADEPLLEAEALEGLRLVDEANLKRGIYHEQRGDISRALDYYEKAGNWEHIGELHDRLQNFQQAGEAFFRARKYEKAGDCFLQSQDIKSAAKAFEMDAQYMRAAELYMQLGPNVKIFSLLEKAGRHCEAAEGYKKHGLLDEAVHACQQVDPSKEDYLKAALIMGKIFIEKNEQTLARSVYAKAVENANITQEKIESYYEFGVLIQEQGLIHEANALFEKLQTVKYNYADVTIRIQNLSERIEQERKAYGTVPPPGTIPPFPGYRTASTAANSLYQTPTPSAGQTPVSSRYVFEKELGRGAMGIVYKAKDTALDRVVAYKTVSNAIKENPASLKYFLSEAKSLAALNHGNIVTVFDVGQEADNFFITMEYVDGRSLGDFIMDKGRLTMKNCVVIATKICNALEYAHKNNIVHRDIKPSNIMISNSGEVKIMDFGLAKIMTEAVMDKTVVRGTPLYMSPEQVEGVGVGHRADLYSFGVTLFEMATGTLPFTKGDIAYHHLHTPPPSPVRYNPSIPEGLEKIILKMLEKTPEDRYQSATDIKRDLQPIREALLSGS